MTAITLDDTYSGQLVPKWWVTPFLVGVMVGAGIMILIMTIVMEAHPWIS